MGKKREHGGNFPSDENLTKQTYPEKSGANLFPIMEFKCCLPTCFQQLLLQVAETATRRT